VLFLYQERERRFGESVKFDKGLRRDPLVLSRSSQLFYILATMDMESVEFSPTSGWEITHCELTDITEFCFPVRLLDMPAMRLLMILLATLVSKPLLNVGWDGCIREYQREGSDA